MEVKLLDWEYRHQHKRLQWMLSLLHRLPKCNFPHNDLSLHINLLGTTTPHPRSPTLLVPHQASPIPSSQRKSHKAPLVTNSVPPSQVEKYQNFSASAQYHQIQNPNTIPIYLTPLLPRNNLPNKNQSFPNTSTIYL